MDSLAGTRSFVLCGTQDLDFASGFLKETHWFGAGSCDRGVVHSALPCTGITPRTKPSKNLGGKRGRRT